MKILKPGKVEQRKFVCDCCGCEFLATHTDRHAVGTYATMVKFVCDCPTCHENILWSEGESYEEPTQDDLERLTGLVHDAPQKHANSWPEAAEIIAKHLIANGVTFREE